MKKRLITIILVCCLIAGAMGQSIPSFWIGRCGLDDYYTTKDGEIDRITVDKTGYYSSGKTYNNKYIYNFSGNNKIHGVLYENGELKRRFMYELDSLNHKIKKIQDIKVPIFGWQREIYVFEYSNDDILIEKHYDKNNSLIRYVKYDYDSFHSPTKLSISNAIGKLISAETACYDYDNCSYTYKVFNENGDKQLQKIEYCNIDTTTNQRNIYGDLIKVLNPRSQPDRNIFYTLDYKYDKKGNWIKRKRFSVIDNKKKRYSIIKRKIKYRQ